MTLRQWVCGGRDIPIVRDGRVVGGYLVLWPVHVRAKNYVIRAINRVFGYE